MYVGKTDLVKIRTDLVFDLPTAHLWTERALERERAYGIHHPRKTWFVIPRCGSAAATIGNICPLLTPLHSTLIKPEESPEDIETRLAILMKVFALCFQTARTHFLLLDEGLSNFGIDTQGSGRLYYLDDDTYPWDDFASFAQLVSVYFRTLEWLTPSRAVTLGAGLRQVILDHWHNSQHLLIVAGRLQDTLLPSPLAPRGL